MFPPMRPRPTMPELHDADRQQLVEGDAAGADAPRLEGAQVAGGLRLLEVAEAERLAGDVDLVRVVAGDLDAHDRRAARPCGAARWSGGTAGRARGSWRPGGGRAARRAPPRGRRPAGRRGRRRPGARGGRRARSWASRSASGCVGDVGAALGEHLGGGGLGGGDVGLVEGLDADGRAGEGDGQLHRHRQVADAVGAARPSRRRWPGGRPPRGRRSGSWERKRRSSP